MPSKIKEKVKNKLKDPRKTAEANSNFKAVWGGKNDAMTVGKKNVFVTTQRGLGSPSRRRSLVRESTAAGRPCKRAHK